MEISGEETGTKPAASKIEELDEKQLKERQRILMHQLGSANKDERARAAFYLSYYKVIGQRSQEGKTGPPSREEVRAKIEDDYPKEYPELPGDVLKILRTLEE
jgi:hypothetical protein